MAMPVLYAGQTKERKVTKLKLVSLGGISVRDKFIEAVLSSNSPPIEQVCMQPSVMSYLYIRTLTSVVDP